LGLGTLTITSAKEGGEKTVQLLPEHVALLKDLPIPFNKKYYFLRHDNGSRYGKDYLYYQWKKACRTLNIKDVDLYGGTKHTTITEWGKKYPLQMIKQAANVTACTERYIHLNEEDVKGLYREARPDNVLTTSILPSRKT
jgi:hypothetical protein